MEEGEKGEVDSNDWLSLVRIPKKQKDDWGS
jgi:hypothetical protein